MPLYKPLAIEPRSLSARLQGFPVRLLVRIYDVGVVTIMMRVAFEANELSDLTPYHNPKLENAESLDAVASKLRAEHKRELKGARRELRKDDQFIARESLREKKERDAPCSHLVGRFSGGGTANAGRAWQPILFGNNSSSFHYSR